MIGFFGGVARGYFWRWGSILGGGGGNAIGGSGIGGVDRLEWLVLWRSFWQGLGAFWAGVWDLVREFVSRIRLGMSGEWMAISGDKMGHFVGVVEWF